MLGACGRGSPGRCGANGSATSSLPRAPARPVSAAADPGARSRRHGLRRVAAGAGAITVTARHPPTAPPPARPPPAVVAAPSADTTAPVVRLGGPQRQRALGAAAIVVTVACPAERCCASATGSVLIPGTARPMTLCAAARHVARGQRVRLRLPLSRRVRRLAQRALRNHASLLASIRVTVTDTARNRTIRTRRVRVTR